MCGDSSHRFLFFERELDLRAETVVIEGDEHRHLARVLRLPVGEQAYVTNGRGVIVRCTVEEVDKRCARLRIDGVELNRAPGPATTLALACLKKDAFERAVEQCTELGISGIVPFVSRKTHLKGYSRGFFERLERITLSAIKQSFQSTLPEIRTVIPFGGVLELVRESTIALVGDSEGAPVESVSVEGPRLIVVGPEGGLTGPEHDLLAAAGAEFVSVSCFRLRAETAAAAMTALVMSRNG